MVSGRTRGTHRGGWRRRSRSARRCPCCPAEENEVKSGGEGGRGANVEVVVVADCGQVVVALPLPKAQDPIRKYAKLRTSPKEFLHLLF